MSDERTVKVEDFGASKASNIHSILEELCGEVCNIYPCNRVTGGPLACVQCFVEFADHASVQRALNLRREDLRVHAMSPNLIEEYHSVRNLSQQVRRSPQIGASAISSLRPSVPLADKTTQMSSPISKTLSPPKRLKSNRSTPISRPRTRDIDYSQSTTQPLSELFSHGTSFIDTLKASASESASNSRSYGRHDKENDRTELSSPAISNISQPHKPISVSRPSNSSLSARIGPHDSDSDHRIEIISGPSFTLETRLIMKLCGEYISYNLDSLEDDPKIIIDLLQASESERDKWMTVACHYHRNGNLGAAIEVVTSMLDVMGKHGVLDKDLKPAFLMLSNCETELSRRAKGPTGEDTAISRDHSQKSYSWLQRVYGNGQGKQQTAPTEISSTSSRPQVQNLTPSTATPADDKMDISHESSTPMIISKTLSDIPTQSAHQRTLEREIASLRDRLKGVTSQLAAVRSAKRKLEDDYDSERIYGRKVERKLDDVECKLDVSKKMESFALDQVRREVDARRRAEDDASKERIKRKELEAAYQARGARPVFEDLADMFDRAAKGQGIGVPNSLASGPGKSNR